MVSDVISNVVSDVVVSDMVSDVVIILCSSSDINSFLFIFFSLQ